MSEINETIAHIACQKCGTRWQVLNDEGTDWDEQATAELYQSGQHTCEPPQE